jgi:hypothetical protein
MTEQVQLEERVTKLELEMAEVRYVATKADKDVADFKTVLVGHTGVINAIRDDQVEHGKQLARVEKEMHAGFARMDENFAKVEDKFAQLREGQEQITDLLTRRLGGPDEEMPAGGTSE